MANYIVIESHEFEEYFEKREELLGEHWEREVVGNEIVYAWKRQYQHHANILTVTIRVFTSVAERGWQAGEGRDVGKDAIRVVTVIRWGSDDNSRPLFVQSERRVHRVKGWRKNLNDRLESAIAKVHSQACYKCGAPMVLRSGKFGEFYSCVLWGETGCEGKRNVT